jgi:preprotein translocase subunit SecF
LLTRLFYIRHALGILSDWTIGKKLVCFYYGICSFRGIHSCEVTMIQLFKDVRIDWLGKRRIFIGISITLLLGGLVSAMYRQAFHPNGTEAFNLGVDFKGGSVITARFLKQRPDADAIRSAMDKGGVRQAVIQPVLSKPDQVLIRIPRQTTADPNSAEAQAQVDPARANVAKALATFGEGNAEIIATDAVGEIAGKQLRNQAIAVTFAALIGMLLFIAFRYEWTYGAAAVIAVFHTVLVTLGLFSIFQWEINMTVIAALLTLVGFDVNDSIVVFDRIRENLRLHRRDTLYDVTNLSINQTLSRTVITAGLVFLSVLAIVLFGGETLRPFALALLMGIIFGTYDSIAIASPIMVWWQRRLGTAEATRGLSTNPAASAYKRPDLKRQSAAVSQTRAR